MCSHYESVKDRPTILRHFGLTHLPEGGKWDLWPGYAGLFIRRHEFAHGGDEAVPQREALIGSFGLIPPWADDIKIARHTYNARSETVALKPSFLDAWKKAQHCIIPADAFYEPDWRSGKAVATRIARADSQPLGIAGLWSCWRSPQGEMVHSYTMLTINAQAHSLMCKFHKPTDEKRMVVILPENQHDAWLDATAAKSMDFLQPYPAESLTAEPVAPRNASLWDD